MKPKCRAEDFIAGLLIVIFGGALYGIWLVPLFQPFTNASLSPPEGLFEALVTLFALVFSISLVAVQLSAQAYSPRSMAIHTRSAYFIGLFFAYLVPIMLILFMSDKGNRPSQVDTRLANSSVLLSAFAILYLVPFSMRTIRLLKPKGLLQEILERVPVGKLATEWRKVSRELQPIFDIQKRSIREGDNYTGKEALSLLKEGLGNLIRRAESEAEATGIVLALAEPFEDLGFFSNQLQNIEITKEIFVTLGALIRCYADSAYPSVARLFYGLVEKLDGDATKRFPKELYQEKLDEIKEAVASCRATMARFIT